MSVEIWALFVVTETVLCLTPGSAVLLVLAAVDAGTRVLLIARASDGAAIGTLQIDLCTRPNGRHRAEVMKVMVPRAAQRRGIGRALMLAADDEAQRLGVTTLVLDTRMGDPSEALYPHDQEAT